ncbi:GPO family capsid scaffolding protein [Vibrio sp.]|nr:GPO family capsid scaffolding protein [Vibrio sp.]
MPKTSDWVIVATAGNTVDGRKITKTWINDMAALYSKEEYTALIWPEHYRSVWTSFEGKNWGIVEELKAEEKDGKLRLYAKLTANQLLLDANKEMQKLFTSIEPNPDYKGEGKCYLMGLAVTDSPASTGTTQLKFSRRDGEETTIESDALEEIDFSQCFTRSDRFFSVCKAFFSSGEQPEHTDDSQPEDEEPMNQEQFKQVMDGISAISTKQGALEEQFNTFSTQQKPEVEGEETPKNDTSGETTSGLTSEQFSQLTEQLKGIADKQGELENQFTQLTKEVPGQRPGETGSSNKMEVF